MDEIWRGIELVICSEEMIDMWFDYKAYKKRAKTEMYSVLALVILFCGEDGTEFKY